MSEPTEPMKQAWNEVADGFTSLGKKITDRYHGEPPAPAADTSAQPGAADHERDPAGALRDAVERLVVAARDLGDRAVDVVRDEEVKTQAKHAATSLNEAISATVDMIGDQISGLFRRPVTESPPTPPVEATASDAEITASDAEVTASGSEPQSPPTEAANDDEPRDEPASDAPPLP